MADSASSPPRAAGGTDRDFAIGEGPLPIAAKRHPLVAEVRRRLTRYVDVTGSPHIIVAVSGGPDSVALLLAMLAMREQESAEIRPQPIIAHVNHHLRDDADEDAAFVRVLGKRFGVLTAVRDVHPRDAGGNLSATSREMRYAALADAAREHDAGYVAVAHHAEDQFETMLMALCRGTGLDGIRAMAWSRPLVEHDERILLVRPLLGSRKAECESLCTAAGIGWCEDTSNRDLDRRRTRLRHEVMLVLETCWPDAPVRSSMTAELLGEAARLLDEKLMEHFGPPDQREWPRASLTNLSPVLVAAGIRRAVHASGGSDESARDDELTQRVLLPAAEAIVDGDRSPREFTLTRSMTLAVRAKTVTLHCSK